MQDSASTHAVEGEVLQRIQSLQQSHFILPLPFVTADDKFVAVERVKENVVRLFFNEKKYYFDIFMGRQVGIKEPYRRGEDGNLQYLPPGEDGRAEAGWRAAAWMREEAIRRWYVVKGLRVLPAADLKALDSSYSHPNAYGLWVDIFNT